MCIASQQSGYLIEYYEIEADCLKKLKQQTKSKSREISVQLASQAFQLTIFI